MPPPLVKVCVLGSSAVGKSTIIHQFVNNRFEEQHEPTTSRGDTFHCSCSFSGRIYHFKILDMPAIKEFPATSLEEWSQFQRAMLRTAHAYIFVFDLNTPATFYYVRVLREQLFESRNMQNVPVWVVGNKTDLCTNVLSGMRSHRHDHHHHHPRPLLHAGPHMSGSPYEDLTPAFKDLANLVRKQWKCSYLECSAKYNWRIVPIFREIVKSLESSLPTATELVAHPTVQSHGPPMTSPRDSQLRCSIKVTGPEQAMATNEVSTRFAWASDQNHTGGSHESNGVCAIV